MQACISISQEQKAILDMLGGSKFIQKTLNDMAATIMFNLNTHQYKTLLQLCRSGVKDFLADGWVFICYKDNPDYFKFFLRVDIDV